MSAIIKRNSVIAITKLFIIMLLFALSSQTLGCAHHALQSPSPAELTSKDQTHLSIPMVYYLPVGRIHVQYKMASKAANAPSSDAAAPAKARGRGLDTGGLPPTITQIDPATIKAGQDTTITITGTNFSTGKSTDNVVEVYNSNGEPIPQVMKPPFVANSTTMKYTVHLQAGSYYFVVNTPGGKSVEKTPLLNVTSDEAPAAAVPASSGGAAATAPDITIETVYEPDPDQCYVLNYRPNISYDDTVNVSLTDNSLLNSVQITSQSQIGPIIMRMVDIAKEAIKLSIPLPGGRAMPPTVIPFDVTIDPKDILPDSFVYPDGKNIIEKELKLPAKSLRLTRIGPEDSPLKNKAILDKPKDSRTICYRPLWPYKFTFKIDGSFNVTKTVYLPNREPVIAIDIARPAFTQAVTNLTFKNGILTVVHLQRQSELLAGLEIPLDVLKAIAGIPAEMLQLKVNYGTNYIQDLNNQIQEIKLKQQLQESKQQKQ
jgi:hypothetical protein